LFSFSAGTLLGRRSRWEFEPFARANPTILALLTGKGSCVRKVSSNTYLGLDARLCATLGNVAGIYYEKQEVGAETTYRQEHPRLRHRE
jgi:hypothetical protein